MPSRLNPKGSHKTTEPFALWEFRHAAQQTDTGVASKAGCVDSDRKRLPTRIPLLRELGRLVLGTIFH